MTAASGVRPRLMRAYSATVGATDGNIIAVIITTHAPRNQPSAPRPVQGPSSMPRIRSTVDHQPMPASTSSSATTHSLARAAANAGASPTRSGADVITGLGGPGELCLRQPALALVLDAERADLRALRLGHREVGAHRMEHAVEPDRLAPLDAEPHDVLDLEVDPVPDADTVPQPVVGHLDPSPLDAQDLTDERRQRGHRAPELPAEHLHQLLHLLVRSLLVDEQPELPVPLGHDLRRVRDGGHGEAADVGALDLSLADVEDQRHAAEVVGRAVIERQVARAHELARARLGVAALQVPRHREPPPVRDVDSLTSAQARQPRSASNRPRQRSEQKICRWTP